MKLDRAGFQLLAQTRIDDAGVLLAQSRWDAAYYLAGYAVECSLKSCVIVRLMATDEFPEKSSPRSAGRTTSISCWILPG